MTNREEQEEKLVNKRLTDLEKRVTALESEESELTVTIQPVTSITNSGGIANGNITVVDGEENPTARGFVWDTASHGDPSLNPPSQSGYPGKVEQAGSFGTGAFTANIANTLPATLYFVRAYATDSEGTTYSEEISFKTLA